MDNNSEANSQQNPQSLTDPAADFTSELNEEQSEALGNNNNENSTSALENSVTEGTEGVPQLVDTALTYQPCFTCNGFYAPSYEDPLCPVCHGFLLTNATSHNAYQTCVPKDSDDEDSGNDEPHEDNDRSSGAEPANDVLIDVPLNEQQRVVDIEQLPPEVMMLTFSYLDDISMWAAAEVNSRWLQIIKHRVTTQQYWKNIVKVRWPLFEEIGCISDWFEVYTSLTRSSCCLKCLRQIALRKLPAEEESNWRQHRLGTELRTLNFDPPDGIKAHPLDPMYCHWIAMMKGPVGSPYEGGIFFLYIHIPYSYPMTPPTVRFMTKIYHPNISRHGDIGIDSLRNNWSLALTICKVLISIQSLLTDPRCEVCMEVEISRIYQTDRTRYDDIAREWTWQYAMTQLMPH